MVGHNVCRFAFEVGIVAGHMVFQTMRFQPRLGEDALHGGFVQTNSPANFRHDQWVLPSMGLLLYSSHHTRLHRHCRNGGLATLVTSLQTQVISFNRLRRERGSTVPLLLSISDSSCPRPEPSAAAAIAVTGMSGHPIVAVLFSGVPEFRSQICSSLR